MEIGLRQVKKHVSVMSERTIVEEAERQKKIYEILHGPNCYHCEFCKGEPATGYEFGGGDYNYFCTGVLGKKYFLASLGDQEDYIRTPADCPK